MNWQPPSFPPHRHRTTQQQQVGQLIIAGALVIFLPQLPLGNYLLYPFTILTTWFHEMGHGLAALALGWEFERLVLLADGSGYAESYSPADPGALAAAFVSLGGPLGPSVIGAALIAATRRHEWWRPALYALAAIILLSTLIWVRSMVGFVVLPLIAAALVAIALRARGGLVRFSVQFLGVLGALSMLRDWHYLFSYSGMIGGRPMLSDTGALEQALWLPYWLWAIVIIAISAAMVGAALKFALAEDGGPHR
ncbi:MAG: M50 family metallopeptidase [Alphaproteobacteria bacterium]|nr:M50 family metallopeptidase [Alphaproteobacteria bacterium]